MFQFTSDKDPVPFFIGFDNYSETLKKIVEFLNNPELASDKFPYYNMYKLDDRNYIIEMNVPGFKPKDIEISLEGTILQVKGTRQIPYAGAPKLFSSLDQVSEFTKKFILSDNMKINEIGFEDGTLHMSFITLTSVAERQGVYPTIFKDGVTPKLPIQEATSNTVPLVIVKPDGDQ